jgi:hypothetical protein
MTDSIKTAIGPVDLLKKVWVAWKRAGRFIGDIVARVVLSVFYFTLFVPFGVAVRLFGDPLDTRTDGRAPRWVGRATQDLALDDARRQY